MTRSSKDGFFQVVVIILISAFLIFMVFACWAVTQANKPIAGIVQKKTFVPEHTEQRTRPMVIGKVIIQMPYTDTVPDQYWLKIENEDGYVKEFTVPKNVYKQAKLGEHFDPTEYRK